MNAGYLFPAAFGIMASFAPFAAGVTLTGDEVLERGPGRVLFAGHPMVDLYGRVDYSVVAELENEKGESRPITHETFRKLGTRVVVEAANAGGSAANTARAFCFLGGTASFFGGVGKDEHGDEFRARLEEYGVTPKLVVREDSNTSQVYCLVTPDKERTMYLLFGASHTVGPSDVDPAVLDDFDYYTVNGFMFANDDNAAFTNLLVEETLKRGKGVITLLANTFAVKRNKKFLLPVVAKSAFVTGNVEEFKLLFDLPVDGELFQFLEARTAGENPVHKAVFVTAGSAGAFVFTKGGRFFVEPAAVGAAVVDTTGAGDFFAGAFLYGVLNGYSLKTSAEFAKLLVGDLVTKMGTLLSADVRPKVDALKASVGRA